MYRTCCQVIPGKTQNAAVIRTTLVDISMKFFSKGKELRKVLPDLIRRKIYVLFRELRKEQRIHRTGNTSAASWLQDHKSRT